MDKIFNVPTAQRALSLVRQGLNEINRQKSEFLTKERFYFSLASDESESNKTCFEFLNRYRDNLRKLRNEESSLILLNKLLKKYMKENKNSVNNINFTNESNSINYLPTIEESDIEFDTTGLTINKEFPTITSKDVKRWFKNNPDKHYIKLFNVEIGDGITLIKDYIVIHREEEFKEIIDNYCYIFPADCFKNTEFFVGKGHRKEYIQKCIDLYGSVKCLIKDGIESEYSEVKKVINIENGNFRVSFLWKYAEVTLENFR